MRGSRSGTWDKEPPRPHNPRHDVFFLFKGQFGVTPTLTPFVALTPKVLRRTKQLYKEKHFYTFFYDHFYTFEEGAQSPFSFRSAEPQFVALSSSSGLGRGARGRGAMLNTL